MNVYSSAHELASAIKASNEFMDYDKLRKEIEQDPTLNQMISDMQKRQIEIQAKQLSGEEIGQDAMAQIQSMYAMMSSNSKAAEYMQAEARFAIMMKDVYEILSDVVKINI